MRANKANIHEAALVAHRYNKAVIVAFNVKYHAVVIYPYLLRGKQITANQVWALDTSYIPMERGFVYLTAVIDWATRKGWHTK